MREREREIEAEKEREGSERSAAYRIWPSLKLPARALENLFQFQKEVSEY